MPDSDGPSAEHPRPDGHGLEVDLLGPFELTVGGRTVHVGSPKQRAVLALLALNAGRVVASDVLCELVWDTHQPASPSATLQSLISRLRRALAGPGGDAGAGGLLRTREPGWALDVEPVAVDALRFAELTARARLRAGRGEMEAAAHDLAAALVLWRGPALADVVDAGYLTAQATRLDQARLDAVEDLAEAELATGRPADALARLEGHVEANRLRERGWGMLMVALYRLGRQTAALRAFQQVRTILGEQLGLEPSPDLADIERRILRHDPTLAAPWPARPVAPAAPSAAPASPAPSSSPRGPEPGEFADYSVVVVEDHDFQRRTLVHLLRGLGVGTVKDAARGAEALAILRAGPVPDVIVCDIDMPGMDGVEFVARVAESNLACAVVIASGLETNVLQAVESLGESQGVHVLAALEKPLTARRLGEVLRQYNRSERARSPQPDRTPLSWDELREAIESGDLAVAFEPRIDLATGTVRGAAAGARWEGPGGPPVPVSAFASALTREGLLLPFVERLVEASASLLDQAGAAGLDLRVAVNVSQLPLADGSLADRLYGLVQGAGRAPRGFVWEVDDVVLPGAPATALSMLTRLRVKGFGLSMNYGGGGPAWTQLLRRVPLSELKLDRRLVSGASQDEKRLSALESTLSTARVTGLPVVADGCDAQADLDTLLALGCTEAQGRFVARPMPAADLVAWALAGYRYDQPDVRS